MGGYGSGRLAETYNYVVEDCLILNIGWLRRHGYLKKSFDDYKLLFWSQNRERISSIGFNLNIDQNSPYIRLKYTYGKTESIEYRISLIKTYPNYGGVRYWLACPKVNCGRKVAKLYKSPDSRYFFCRTCQNLTYQSCRDSHEYDNLYGKIGADVGMSASRVKKLLKQRRA